MDIENTVRRFSLDKVALLGFLALGLLAAKLLVFTRNEKPLQAGTQLVEAVKSGEIIKQSAGQKTVMSFLMKNKNNQPVGFIVNQFDVKDSKLRDNSIFYIQSPLHQERVVSFEGSADLSEFVWKYDAASPYTRASLQTQFGNSVLIVTNFELAGREYRLNPQSPWLPDVLVVPVMRNMLDSDISKAILELLVPEGRLMPAMISTVKTKDTDYDIVTIEYLGSEGAAEQYTFNKDRTIRQIETTDGFTFQPVSIQTILALFPEKADYILHQFNLLQKQDNEQNDRNIYKNSV